MTTVDGGHHLPDSVRQVVVAEAGHAYGVIGADLHVISGRGPAYLLTNRASTGPDATLSPGTDGPPAHPSYLLNARSAVVGFTGRQAEVGELTTWRDTNQGLAVRWLHAPGGQGKTRLAGQIADDALRNRWKVVVADHTAGRIDARNPTSQDLRIGPAAGLLMVVDYADRWPLAHLTWLFSNAVLNQAVPVRVLLLARTSHTWPALCHALTQAGWPPRSCTIHALGPLPDAQDSRGQMFTAARDSFARFYRLPDPRVIAVPDGLERDEFGLTLAVHMAALVAVDRHVHTAAATQPPPLEDMTGLTAYLLGREQHHWRTLYDTGAVPAGSDPAGGRAAFGTAPDQMSRVVFTAALTGPLSYRDARAALDTVGLGGVGVGVGVGGGGTDTDRVLTDHTFCYPPADPRTVLEPLYPDRLAEDFLALTLPGHDVASYPADPWAEGIPRLLLTPVDKPANKPADTPADEDAPLPLPPYAARAITFLTSASDRWPHLVDTLETLDPLLPDDIRDEFANAAADLAERVAHHRLPTVTLPAARAQLYDKLGQRLDQAGRNEKAAAAHTEARRLYRQLAAADPRAFEPELAASALRLAQALVHVGLMAGIEEVTRSVGGRRRGPGSARPQETVAAFDEAVGTFRRLAGEDPAEHTEDLVAALLVSAAMLPHLGQVDRAVALAREAAELARGLAQEAPADHEVDVPYVLTVLAGTLTESQPEQATALAAEAVDLVRQLPHDDTAEHNAHLHYVLAAQAGIFMRVGRAGDALATLSSAARYRRDQSGRTAPDRDAWRDALFQMLGFAWVQGSADDVTSLDTAFEILRSQARDHPAGHEHALLDAFLWLQGLLEQRGRRAEVLAVQREIVELLRSSEEFRGDGDRLRRDDVHGVLAVNGMVLAELGRWDEAVATIGEAAAELDAELEAAGNSGGLEACLASVLTEVVANVTDLPPAGTTDPYVRMARAEAVVVLDQIAATYRRLVPTDPAAHEHGLAVTLKILAEALWTLGRHEDAVVTAGEAVDLRRRLARDGTAQRREHLALALRRLADKLTDLGRSEKAAAAAGEAVDLRRALTREDRAEHEAALAAALHLLARNLRRLRPENAVGPAREAVGILAGLASADPAKREPDLAVALDNLGSILQVLGRVEECRAARSEAVRVLRRCAESDQSNLPHLAQELWDVARLPTADAAGRAGAWIAVEEAVDLYARLAAECPGEFTSALHGARATRDDLLAALTDRTDGSADTPAPVPMGTLARYAVGDDNEPWLVLLDPGWRASTPQDRPPEAAMVGGWELDANGQAGPFQPNPGYAPAHAAAPTDPTDFLLHLAAAGGPVGGHLVSTVRNSVLEIACDEHGQPLVGRAPDGAPCVLVVTAPYHRRRLLLERWWPVRGSVLPTIVPGGVDILLNPGGPAQLRLLTAALRT